MTDGETGKVQRQARAAGLLYVVMALFAPISILYVPSKVIVSGNATATADNIRAFEGLFRIGIASELFHQALAVFLLLALYRLFKPVNETHAKLMLILGSLVSVPIMFVNVLNDVAALVLVSGADFLSVFDRPERDALAYLFVQLHGYGITVASVFWGLWLFPFGMLVIRSGFIPRFLGYLLMAAGVGYLASAFATLTLPRYADLVSKIALPLELGELPIIVWLAIWGARRPPAEVPAT